MIEICSVLAIIGLIVLINWADSGRIARRFRDGAKAKTQKPLMSVIQENAILAGRPIIIQTKERELTFFPDGHVDEKTFAK